MHMTKIAIALIAAGTLAFAACGKKDEKKKDEGDKTSETAKPAGDTTAAKPAEEPKPAADGDKKLPGDELMGKVATMFNALDAAITGEGDCAAKVAAVTKVAGEHKAVVDEMKTFDENAAKAEFGKKHPDVMKKMAGWGAAMGECKELAGAMKFLN